MSDPMLDFLAALSDWAEERRGETEGLERICAEPNGSGLPPGHYHGRDSGFRCIAHNCKTATHGVLRDLNETPEQLRKNPRVDAWSLFAKPLGGSA